MQNADFDRVLGLGGHCHHKAESQTGRGRKPAAASRPPSGRAIGVEHRDVLCLTRNGPGAIPLNKVNGKERAKLWRDLRY